MRELQGDLGFEPLFVLLSSVVFKFGLVHDYSCRALSLLEVHFLSALLFGLLEVLKFCLQLVV